MDLLEVGLEDACRIICTRYSSIPKRRAATSQFRPKYYLVSVFMYVCVSSVDRWWVSCLFHCNKEVGVVSYSYSYVRWEGAFGMCLTTDLVH